MVKLARRAHAPRSSESESEKITVNLGFVDLGQIDLLVREAFYANRTDFIRTAIRNQLNRHDSAVQSSVARNALELGIRTYAKADLEAARAQRTKLHIQVLGLAVIAPDVTPDLARDAIASVQVL